MKNSDTPHKIDKFGDWVQRNEKIVVSGVIALALALRFFHLHEIKINDPFYTLPSVDPSVYHKWAVSIVEGDIWGNDVFFLSPLYPYFLSLIYKVFGIGHTIAKVIQVLISALNCYLIYTIGKRTFNAQVGLFASFIWSIYSISIFYDGILLVTAIQTPLNLLTVLLLLKSMDSHTNRDWFLSGMVLGLSALARPNVLLFSFFVLSWLLFHFIKRSFNLSFVLSGVVFCLGVALPIVPISIRNFLVGDDMVLISAQGGVNFYIGNGPGATGRFRVPNFFLDTRADDPTQQQDTYRKYAEYKTGRTLKPSEVSRFWYYQTFDYIRENPGSWAQLLLKKFRFFFNQHEIANSRHFYSSRRFSTILSLPLPGFSMVGTLALVGMVLAWRQRRRAFLLYSMVVTYTLSLMLFFVLAHYRMPVLPFVVIFAGVSLEWMRSEINAKRYRWLPVAFLGLIFSSLFVNDNIDELSEDDPMIHYNLGNKYRKMGRKENAISEYEKAIQGAPNYISAYNNLAVTHEKEPINFDEALIAWRHVLRLARINGDQMYIDRASRRIRMLQEYRKTNHLTSQTNKQR